MFRIPIALWRNRLYRYWAVVTSSLLVILIAALQHSPLPLYDGVSLPDEPYRYVHAPAGKGTKKPAGGAFGTGLSTGGFNKDGIFLNTDEQGPQIYLSFTQHCFQTSLQATILDARITPLASDSTVTPLGNIAGNIYRVTATSDNGPVTFVDNKTTPSYVDMRLPQGYAVGATFVYRPDATASWRQLDTSRVGNDIYEAKVTGLGDYALTGKLQPAAAAGKKIFIFIGVIAVLCFVVIVLRRRERNKSSQPDGAGDA